jgi:hypothetical protein
VDSVRGRGFLFPTRCCSPSDGLIEVDDRPRQGCNSNVVLFS